MEEYNSVKSFYSLHEKIDEVVQHNILNIATLFSKLGWHSLNHSRKNRSKNKLVSI
jgi:hypothetical protein